MYMETIKIKTRKFQGETYTFYLKIPSYPNEKGCLNIKIEPYVEVKTEENVFGYTDSILFDGNTRSLYRHCPNWILRECYKVQQKIMDNVDRYIDKHIRYRVKEVDKTHTCKYSKLFKNYEDAEKLTFDGVIDGKFTYIETIVL